MESPGEYIRRERKLREISLKDVSGSIKVQIKLLKALESDNYDELPHSTFVKGFFRAYAKYLGLDDNDIILRYEDYREEFYDDIELNNDPPVTFPHATTTGQLRSLEEDRDDPRKKQIVAVVIIASVILTGIAYLIFSGSSEVSYLPDAVTPQAALTLANEGNEQGGGGDGAGGADKESPEPVTAAKVSAAVDKTPLLVKETSAPRKEGQKAVKKPVKPVKPIKKEDPATSKAATVATVSGHTLVAHANSTTWMRVDIDGVKSKEALLQPGEKVTWRARKGFSILVGNAGGVTFTFDGADMGAPGAEDETIRVSFPKGVNLPRVVVKSVQRKAPEKDKEVKKPLVKAVKKAPVEAAPVKEDSLPTGSSETRAEGVVPVDKDVKDVPVPVIDEKVAPPAAPDTIKEPIEAALPEDKAPPEKAPPEKTPPEKTPEEKTQSSTEPPEAEEATSGTEALKDTVPEEMPAVTPPVTPEGGAQDGTAEPAPAASVGAGDTKDKAATESSVEDSPPSDGGDVAAEESATEEGVKTIEEEIDPIDDDL